ncbi:hypothetical protein [Rhodococcus chondri]|uniref:Acyl-CoA dehydrogenase n=1 Tax=Rhodococcus chondri TaxID=3065941 RepID=A0ABU7JS23_9NOCA|nr:hypothetical protein [Rhodococcus sp. CC-R104]MEE2032828.1 hypothetical protein [Rhodococcus sp. CC-R104]
MTTEKAVLEALYAQFTELSERENTTDPRALGYRSAMARARLFALDEQVGVFGLRA